MDLVQTAESGYAIADTATTDLDGKFAFNHVEQGNYYAVPVLPGYVNLMSVLTKSHMDAITVDDRKKLLAQVTGLSVSANQPAQVSLRLERGTQIDGVASYDDGSPAIGLHVSVALKADVESHAADPSSTSSPPIYSGAGPQTTDDRGRFKILGLLPGVYEVSVSVPVKWAQTDLNPQAEVMESSIGSMDVYVGGGQRVSKAEAIKVTAGGASKDADITIPLSRLHTIRGQVLLKSTNQPPSAATVRLLYADTREPARSMVAPNGEFEFHYVPEDSFILRAAASPALLQQTGGDDSGSGPPMGRFSVVVQPGDGESEGGAEMPLTVTSDMDGVSISVPDPQPSTQGAPNQGVQTNSSN